MNDPLEREPRHLSKEQAVIQMMIDFENDSTRKRIQNEYLLSLRIGASLRQIEVFERTIQDNIERIEANNRYVDWLKHKATEAPAKK